MKTLPFTWQGLLIWIVMDKDRARINIYFLFSLFCFLLLHPPDSVDHHNPVGVTCFWVTCKVNYISTNSSYVRQITIFIVFQNIFCQLKMVGIVKLRNLARNNKRSFLFIFFILLCTCHKAQEPPKVVGYWIRLLESIKGVGRGAYCEPNIGLISVDLGTWWG